MSLYAISNTLASRPTVSQVVTATASAAPRPVVMTVAQAQAAEDNDTLPAAVTIRDTTANIQNGLSSLLDFAKSGALADVVFTRPGATLTMTQSQLENSTLFNAVKEATLRTAAPTTVNVDTQNAKLLNGKRISGLSFNITDTAQNIKSNINWIYTLHTASKLGTLKTDPNTQTNVQLTAVQAANASFLTKLSPATNELDLELTTTARDFNANRANIVTNSGSLSKVTITDTAANISSMLSGWTAGDLATTAPKIDLFAVQGPGAIRMTAATAVNSDIRSALDAASVKPSVQVVDTAANLDSNKSSLQNWRNTYANPNQISLVARDSAANIKSKFVGLEELSKSGALTGVEITNTGKVMQDVKVSDLTDYAGVFAAFAKNGGTLKIKDTAANISGSLDSIAKMVSSQIITAKSGGIEVDSTAPLTISLSQDQYMTYAPVRGLLKGSAVQYNIKLSDEKNVLSQYRDEFSKITMGSQDDSVFVSKKVDLNAMEVDMGGGSGDTIYFEGKMSDWSIAYVKSGDIRKYLQGETVIDPWGSAARTDVTLQDANTTTLRYNILVNQLLPENASGTTPEDKQLVFRFTESSGSDPKKITVSNAERFAFIDKAMLPKGTVNLLA